MSEKINCECVNCNKEFLVPKTLLLYPKSFLPQIGRCPWCRGKRIQVVKG